MSIKKIFEKALKKSKGSKDSDLLKVKTESERLEDEKDENEGGSADEPTLEYLNSDVDIAKAIVAKTKSGDIEWSIEENTDTQIVWVGKLIPHQPFTFISPWTYIKLDIPSISPSNGWQELIFNARFAEDSQLTDDEINAKTKELNDKYIEDCAAVSSLSITKKYQKNEAPNSIISINVSNCLEYIVSLIHLLDDKYRIYTNPCSELIR